MKIKVLLNTVLMALAIICCPEASGQQSDTLKNEFDLQIAGQRKRGIFSQTSLRASANTKLQNNKLVFTNISSYTYTTVNRVAIADDWHFRTILMYKLKSKPGLQPAIAHNYFENLLYRIKGSHRILGGLRVLPFKKYKNFAFLIGSGYEFSQYANDEFVNSPLVSNQRDFSLAFGNISGKHTLSKMVVFEYNLSYVQSLIEAADYSFWLLTSLKIPLNKTFLVGLSYDLRFRNVHLVNVPPFNDLLLFNLSFKLTY